MRTRLNNFRHELSTTVMPQTFKGSNDLCIKAYDVEIHLNKHKKRDKGSGKKFSFPRESPYNVS